MSSLVSYAQNYEDVLLLRVLKGVENGFYVDVGANDPIVDSVTKNFYDRGWNGLNVEPLPSHYKALTKFREKDINVNCAVSDVNDSLEIWECEIRGWATLDKSVAAMHESNGHIGEWHSTKVRMLKDILDEHLTSEAKIIHFLKIDVEGLEKNVILGNDWRKHRPWIVVVESIKPNSRDENHGDWEFILLNNDYQYVYSDGINRYYLAVEKSELKEMFKYPPNIFDNFISVSEFKSNADNHSLNLKLAIFERKIEQLSKNIEDLKEQLIKSEEEVNLITSSTSWRLTAPLRHISEFFKGKIK